MAQAKDYFGQDIQKGQRVIYQSSMSTFHYEKAIVEAVVQKPKTVVVVLNCQVFGRHEVRNSNRLIVVDTINNTDWKWKKRGF